MKPATIGCFLGSVAALVFSGCVDRETATRVTYDRGPYAGQTVLVGKRPMVIDNQQTVVPIYRTGDAYFYVWGGRRYTFTEYPWGPRQPVPGPSYATTSPGWYRGNAYERRVVRRSALRLMPDGYESVSSGEVGYDFDDDVEGNFVNGERDLRLRF